MSPLSQVFNLIFDVVWFVILAHIIMSWLINFQILNLRQPFVYQLWGGLNRLLEPIYGPIRRVLPPMGGFDLSPLIVIFALMFLRSLV